MTNVRDTFRSRNAGKVNAPFNSKSATSNAFVDRSRLGTHEEYDPEVPNDYGGKGKFASKPNSILDNVRGAMGGIGARSSFRSVHETAGPNGADVLSYESRPRNNPLMRRKGD